MVLTSAPMAPDVASDTDSKLKAIVYIDKYKLTRYKWEEKEKKKLGSVSCEMNSLMSAGHL